MIAPLNVFLSRIAARSAAPVNHEPAARQVRAADFGKLLQPQKSDALTAAPVVIKTVTSEPQPAIAPRIAPKEVAPASPPAPSDGVKRLGPFADNTVFGPTVPPVSPNTPAAVRALADPKDIPSPPAAGDPFSREGHEANMNAWVEQQIQTMNDFKMQVYNQAMANWKANEPRYRALGMPVPPQPQPPVLDPVAPMPNGWWSGGVSA